MIEYVGNRLLRVELEDAEDAEPPSDELQTEFVTNAAELPAAQTLGYTLDTMKSSRVYNFTYNGIVRGAELKRVGEALVRCWRLVTQPDDQVLRWGEDAEHQGAEDRP